MWPVRDKGSGQVTALLQLRKLVTTPKTHFKAAESSPSDSMMIRANVEQRGGWAGKDFEGLAEDRGGHGFPTKDCKQGDLCKPSLALEKGGSRWEDH